MLPYVQDYTRNFPSVNLRIEQGSHQDILKGVLDYALDFGIVHKNHELSLAATSFQSELLYYFNMYLS